MQQNSDGVTLNGLSTLSWQLPTYSGSFIIFMAIPVSIFPTK